MARVSKSLVRSAFALAALSVASATAMSGGASYFTFPSSACGSSSSSTSSYRPRANLGAAPYAPWAHYHAVWLDSSRSNQSNTVSFVQSWADHNITVGAVDFDSEWSTGNNNFVVDTAKFPDMKGLITQLHAQNQRVILWATSMVDTDSSNYQEAVQKGYLVRDIFNQTANISWWHGTGGLLDYTSPDARAWWEGQLDNVLGIGIDGWKCDGTDPYILLVIGAQGYGGPITYPEYADGYYGHFFNYSRTINSEALIWSRPVDSPGVIGALNISVFLPYSPHYVLFSGWVGDQDPTFDGLRDAMINMLESAWQNYTNFGSDTSGYRSGVRTREEFLRWSQVNAFLPLFENGGNDLHTPWSYEQSPTDTSTTDVYRRLVSAHYELVPYLLSTGSAAYAAGVSSIQPTSAPPADFPFPIQPDQVSDWSYALGPTMFASPVVYGNVTVQSVTLPSSARKAELVRLYGRGAARIAGERDRVCGGGEGEGEWVGQQLAAPLFPSISTAASTAAASGWYEYWQPSNTHPPGAVVQYPVPLVGVPFSSMVNPVFVAEGSILPLHVSTHLGHVRQGHRAWAAALTLVVQGLDTASRSGADDKTTTSTSLTLVEAEGSSGLIATAATAATMNSNSGRYFTFNASAYDRPIILVLRRRAAAAGSGVSGGVASAAKVLLVTSSSSSSSGGQGEGKGEGQGEGEGGRGRLLTQRAPEPARPLSSSVAALSWDATSVTGGKYPVGSTHAEVHAQYARELAGTFSVGRVVGGGEGEGEGEEKGGSNMEEVVVYVGLEEARMGFDLEIELA